MAAEQGAGKRQGERSGGSRRIFVGLGANLGKPLAMLQRAIQQLNQLPEMTLISASGSYRSAPWGGRTDRPFINGVVEFSSRLDAHNLLDALTSVEFTLGRRRSEETRWGDRCIDLDLLAAGNQQISRPGLWVPHPRLGLRRFVLLPWAEIAPDFVVPGHWLSVSELLSQCADTGQVERLQERLCSA